MPTFTTGIIDGLLLVSGIVALNMGLSLDLSVYMAWVCLMGTVTGSRGLEGDTGTNRTI